MSDAERVAEIVGEWRERIDRGEEADVETLIGEHPDLAEALRERFAALRLFEKRFATGAAAVPPSAIGEYTILRELGRGGMGVVYEAEQTSMRRKVALKVLFPSVTSTPEAVKRFQHEAWAAGRVKHTSIVSVYQLGHDGGTWYCAMELVEGRPLSRVIEELRHERRTLRESRLARRAVGVPTPSPLLAQTPTGSRAYYLRVAEMFADVAEALQIAHDHGIVHRDVKPSNLLLDAEGRLKLADFGLARLQDVAGAMTRTGEIVGTPLYMSPEQVAGQRDVDGRADVYSLGATLYETLTLRPPFRGGTVAALAAEVTRSEPAAPRRIDEQIPKDLETIVLKALEKEPSRRYRTAGDMARDLRAFIHGGVVRARRVGPIGRLARKVRRNKIRAALGAALLVATGVAVVFGVRGSHDRERRADLEYESLCLEADRAIAREASWAEPARPGLPLAAVAPGQGAVEILDAAIRLRPARPEAYFMRALASGRTLDERVADLEAGGARGLPERSWRLAKASVLADAGRTADAEAEERLAAQAGPADASTLLAEGLLARRRGDRKGALARISEALTFPDSPTSVRCRALWWRSVLLEQAGDLNGAVADLHALRVWTGDRVTVVARVGSLRRRLGHEVEAETLFGEAARAAGEVASEEAWRSLARECHDCEEFAWMERAAASGLLRFPGSACLHNARGNALDALGRHEEALFEHDRAIELAPDLASAHHDRGNVLMTLGRPEDALGAYNRALELAPRSASTHNSRGVLLGDCFGRPEDALDEFDRAIELDPRCGEAYHNRAVAFEILGRFKEALADYGRALELEPTAGHHLERARVFTMLGQPAEAWAEYDRALELDPGNAEVRRRRGIALAESGRMEASLAEFDLALESDPKNAKTHVNRGAALWALGRRDDALAAFERALDLDPTDAMARRNRGAALAELGRCDDALAELDRAIALDPKSAALRYNRGEILNRLGRPDDALTSYDEASALDPTLACAHDARGNVLWALGRAKEALAAYERVAELEPANVLMLNRVAWERAANPDLSLRDPAKAVAFATRAVKVAPGDGAIWNTLGVALCRAERWAEALDALDKSMSLREGGDASDWFFVAQALWRTDKRDKARDVYGKAVAWADEHAPQDGELRRFREETAATLGLKPD